MTGEAPAESPLRPPLWSLDYTLTLLGTFSFFGSFFYLLSVLPDYANEIGASNWQIALIVAAFSFVSLPLRVFAGRWSDRGHRKRLMRIGLAAMVVSLGLMAFSADVISLFLLRAIQGLGISLYPTAAGSLVAELAPVPRRGEGLGFFGMASSGGQMVTPALGVLIAERWGFEAVFVVAALTAAVTLLFVQRVHEPPAHPRADGEPLTALIPRRAVFPMTLFLTVTIAFTAAATFLPLLGDERGLGNVGLFFLVSGFCAAFGRPLAGRLSDALGRTPVIAPGLLLTAASMAMLAMAQGPGMLLLAGLASGVGFGAAHTGIFALSLDRVAANERGGATAVFQMAWDIGGAIGGLVFGVIASGLDVVSVFWFAGAIVIVAVAALFLERGETPATARAQP